MTDLATLYHNRAFSPRNGPLSAPDAGQHPQSPPQLQLTDLKSQQQQQHGPRPFHATLSNGQQPVGKQPALPSSSPLSLAPTAVSIRSPSSSSSTSSASSSASSSGRRGSAASDDGRRRRDRQPARAGHAERRQQRDRQTAAAPAMSAEAMEEEEHRWLLHSSRIALAYSEQLVETESPYYPKLIEQELIIDDSRDDDNAEADDFVVVSSRRTAEQVSAASSPVSPLSSHSFSAVRLPASLPASASSPPHTADLISSYEQLSFIRFPPSLWSLLLHRYVYAALGLLQEPWPVWKQSRSDDDELWWVWWLWCWQAVWALACVLGLGWLCWLRVVESESESPLTRALLSGCDVVSVCCALLLSHAVLSHRMLGSRVYFLHRNSSSPRSATAAVNRAVYLSLAALVLIAAAGIYLDTRTVPSSLPSSSSSLPELQPAVLSLQLTAQAWLWLSCVLLLRLQYAAGVCVLVCLLDIHILRVEQARKAVAAAEGDEEGVAAQVLDIELSVQDLADRLSSVVSVLLGACVLAAVTAAISAVDSTDAAAGGARQLRLLYPLLVALFLLQAVTRLNQSCSRFRGAVLCFPLLHPHLPPAAAASAAAAAAPPARPPLLWMSVPCPEVSLPVCGVRLSYGSLWLFVLLWSALLLWLTQMGRLN